MLSLYRQMLVIRRCEEQLVKASQSGVVIGPCHTYIGEEAVAVGVCAHLRDADTVFSTHRGHGHSLAKGVTPRELIAELYGRSTGCSGGRGGSMHLFKPEVGLMGTSGIVGPSITLASGAAYTHKLLGTDRVSVAFFGDGASNNGSFHEGINMATAWDLPALFVCENNLYATEVAFSYASKSPSVAARGQGYGLPGIQVDGNDVLAVYEAAGEAVERARSGQGPTLLECMTYRVRPHAEGMRDTGYRTREEVEQWKERCPIRRLGETLVQQGQAARQDLDRIDDEVKAIVADAHEFSLNSPWPDPETVADHLYSNG
jgi:2-oxoisovalerate dehydrogenase E1 component